MNNYCTWEKVFVYVIIYGRKSLRVIRVGQKSLYMSQEMIESIRIRPQRWLDVSAYVLEDGSLCICHQRQQITSEMVECICIILRKDRKYLYYVLRDIRKFMYMSSETVECLCIYIYVCISPGTVDKV